MALFEMTKRLDGRKLRQAGDFLSAVSAWIRGRVYLLRRLVRPVGDPRKPGLRALLCKCVSNLVRDAMAGSPPNARPPPCPE